MAQSAAGVWGTAPCSWPHRGREAAPCTQGASTSSPAASASRPSTPAWPLRRRTTKDRSRRPEKPAVHLRAPGSRTHRPVLAQPSRRSLRQPQPHTVGQIRRVSFGEQAWVNSDERQGEADFQTFMVPALPVDTLKTLMFDRVSAQGRALALVSLIDNAEAGLRQASGKRDSLIDMLKANPPPTDVLPLLYFGEKLLSGHTHREYADLVEVVHSYTDDLIFFSADLCGELVKYGQALRADFVKRHKKGAPNITEPDFEGPRKTGLFPKEENYSSWRGWIVEKPSSTQVPGLHRQSRGCEDQGGRPGHRQTQDHHPRADMPHTRSPLD